MAINTDVAYEKDMLGESESGTPHHAVYKDTQKLLGVSASEESEGHSLKPLDSLSLSIRGSVRSLNAEQNGRRSPMKSGSIGNIAVPSPSPSRLSFSRASSPGPQAPAPPNYLWLALLSCFCPSFPLNLFALYYSHTSRSLQQVGDDDGARRLGKLARLLSIIAILVGVAVLLYIIIGEANGIF
ncbi:trafficking regulator of GLUT4 (SLC2A4) 1b [Alosa sapidissima]|uniref:trafficking regulator of GLUT4 (SLC2A4) 1b n=1 Tax=Alosa sapidissima TaxID=34773 RepID=UPI001C097CD9|nr:trafficking regulator of GLUT4 (SLC2A4) 1b [Alosa sapidissima]